MRDDGWTLLSAPVYDSDDDDFFSPSRTPVPAEAGPSHSTGAAPRSAETVLPLAAPADCLTQHGSSVLLAPPPHSCVSFRGAETAADEGVALRLVASRATETAGAAGFSLQLSRPTARAAPETAAASVATQGLVSSTSTTLFYSPMPRALRRPVS
eukprot:TRINITY_DN704_c0_g1_i1.p2 TRINITY_DN704_c0_g1~~TRINITY_DN704_c0_g1_i1.p2  ORF type:complete len:164 (-),score=31.65 TRINITY_DN704_c0_g1_i1:67-531(-)